MKQTRLLQPIARNHAFTLVEIMIVCAIIALLAAVAVPGFLRARKRSQGVAIRTDLRLIDGAMDQYALEYNRSGPTPRSRSPPGSYTSNPALVCTQPT